MDANKQWGNPSEVTKFAKNFDLHDIGTEFQLKETHPNIANISRSTTIDFCMCSANLLQSVVHAASTPFDLETLGDHRGILIDIDLKLILGKDSQVADIKNRKLVISSPRSVDKYLEIVETKFKGQNIFRRSMKLLRQVEDGHTDLAGIMTLYEEIDREVFGICLKAEKKCKAAWAGNYEWSPQLVTAIKRLRYWRHRVKKEEETAIVKKLGKELNIKYNKLSQVVSDNIWSIQVGNN